MQGLIYRNGAEGPLSVSVPGASACSSRSQFSPFTKACLFFFPSSPSLWMPKSGSVPEYPPSSRKLRRGQGLVPSPWLQKRLPDPLVPSVRQL